MKLCNYCKQEKPFSEFNKAKTNKDGSICYQSKCKLCYNKVGLEKYHNLPIEEKRKRASRNYMGFDYFKNYKLQKHYGLSREDFNKMYESQNGKCHLCERNIEGKEVKVDHNHETGQVRKLLCHNCNTSLGLLSENPELFYKCADYLKEHNDSIPKCPLA